MKQARTLVTYLLLFVIIVMTFTPAVGYVPLFRKSWLFILPALAAVLAVNPGYFKNKAWLMLATSGIIMFLNVISKDAYYKDMVMVVMELSMLGLTSAMFVHAMNDIHRQRFLKWVLLTFFLILAIETTASYFIDRQMHGAIRLLFSESIFTGERDEYMYPYYRLGLSNYSLPHALPMLIPSLVMGIMDRHSSHRLRLLSSLFLIFDLVLVWLSGVMTAFLMATVFLVLAVYTSSSKKPNLKFFIGIAILFVPFLIFDELTLSVLHIAEDLFKGSHYIYYKLQLIEESLTYQAATGDVLERQNLYMVSLNEVASNIFIGTNNPLGNHSTFVDRFATLGLVGFIPYISFFYLQISYMRRYIPENTRLYYDEAIWAGLLMMAVKDVDDWEIYLTLFTIVPLLTIYLSPKYVRR